MNLAMLTLNSSVHPELVEGPLCFDYPETVHPELVEGPLCSHYPETVYPELVEGPLCSHYPETIHPELVEGPLCFDYPETVYPELVEGPLCSRDYIILTVPFDCSLRLLRAQGERRRSGRTVYGYGLTRHSIH